MSDPSVASPSREGADEGQDDVPSPLAEAVERDQEDERSGNSRSSIGFVYTALRDAEQIASELHNKWGGSASPDQLSAGMGTTPRSGTFRMRIATARTSGVVDVGRGKVSITPLGQRLIDGQTQEAARVETFLKVPLFKALFDEYQGSVLPPDGGLEQKIEGLGVSAKQVSRARQTFQRSAEWAGFFKQGRNRLVMPPVQHSQRLPNPKPNDEVPRMNPSAAAGPLPTPVADLWVTLLEDGRSWSVDKTQEFIEAARKLREVLTKD